MQSETWFADMRLDKRKLRIVLTRTTQLVIGLLIALAIMYVPD